MTRIAGPAHLPAAAHLAALTSLDGAGPARLGRLLAQASPAEAWAAVLAGAPWVGVAAGSADLARRWRREAGRIDPAMALAQLRHHGFGVVDEASPAYPCALRGDVDAPPVLFADGDLDAIAHRRAAVVGTRRCTRYGRDVAFELGALLAARGVSVVSGLALGIDAAAHEGALSVRGAPPVAIVASGLDRPYPARNAALWRSVASAGVVLSEAPLGARPERWRFPARNRIIAALAEVVVVVESHVAGGSMYTVSEAMLRDRPVMAVPGPIRSPASWGTNQLLADGAHVVCAPDDVLGLLGLLGPTSPSAGGDRVERPPLDPEEASVLDALAWQPTDVDTLATATGLGLDRLAGALGRLEDAGVVERRGGWYERRARRDAS